MFWIGVLSTWSTASHTRWMSELHRYLPTIIHRMSSNCPMYWYPNFNIHTTMPRLCPTSWLPTNRMSMQGLWWICLCSTVQSTATSKTCRLSKVHHDLLRSIICLSTYYPMHWRTAIDIRATMHRLWPNSWLPANRLRLQRLSWSHFDTAYESTTTAACSWLP